MKKNLELFILQFYFCNETFDFYEWGFPPYRDILLQFFASQAKALSVDTDQMTFNIYPLDTFYIK